MPSQRLSDVYNAQIKALKARVEQFASTRFAAGQFRDADLARFVAEVVPVVQAGQVQVAALTDSYLTQLLTAQGIKVPPRKPVDMSHMRGVLATNEYGRPYITVRTALAQGSTFDDAVKQGGARLVDLVTTDMQLAKTHAARNVMKSSGLQFYQRVLTGGKNCALCMIASTQRYWVEDLMPIHPGCDCGVEPLVPGTKLYAAMDGGERVIDPSLLEQTHNMVKGLTGVEDRGGRAPDYRKLIAVHEHGEIGPVLTFAHQNFTGPSDLP